MHGLITLLNRAESVDAFMKKKRDSARLHLNIVETLGTILTTKKVQMFDLMPRGKFVWPKTKVL